MTIRPPGHVQFCAALHPVLEALGPDPAARLREPRHELVPHPPDLHHPQYAGGGDMDYGEAVVTLAYVRARWAELLELLRVGLLIGDPFQLMPALRAA